MKQKSLLLFVLIVFGCKNQVNLQPNKVETKKNIKNQMNESKDVGIITCDFTDFLNDPKVPEVAKGLFERKYILDEDELFGLLEKLKSKDLKERVFYFRVITNSFEIGDGAFGEGLGYAGKEFVDNNTKEFLSYFENKDCFNYDDLRKWSKILILEIAIDSETQKIDVIENYITELKSKCNKCNSNQNLILIEFGKYLKIDWIEYLKVNE